MLSEFVRPIAEDAIFVLELSSYMLETLPVGPQIAVMLNIFPEHLDYHGSMEAYVHAKAQITLTQRAQDVFIYNAQDLRIAEIATKTPARTIPFVTPMPYTDAQLEQVNLKGKHFYTDMCAAYTVAHYLHVPDETIFQAFITYQPLPHRLQFVGEFRGIKFYDDAIATAPEPTIHAMQTLGNVDTLMLGGTDRGLNYSTLAQAVCESSIQNLILFPDTGKEMFAVITETCKRPFNVLETSSMEEAVKFAYAHTAQGKSCLLSCAAPSYSLWQNFEEKGNAFQEVVRLLAV